ncbi:CTP synthetase [Candidatus Woesearchaeota archaeon]|nr:CTP synthetase [Candidatus Woesearchaeota archaeon]|tara:strand:- start:965 stop:2554 length:1590 start_codon:yes stop_codon:yes gene_type:complete
MPKWIVVTGGVLSGLGKGVASASIGKLLNTQKIVPIKCDGYLNVDPGTMNPIEHGEVFVLEDGGEVDMDFGHYERFLGVMCKSEWNLTMGKVFHKIREKERRGDYLGKTVQFIPHVTQLIKDWWREIAQKEEADVMLVEIGGTVGDIENELYIEAARQLQHEEERKDSLFIHLTYVPTPKGTKEQKSKPTQQSVNLLLQKGIQPDIVIGRCREDLDESVKEKIALFSNLNKDAVISGMDMEDIYEVPVTFYEQGILDNINKKLKTNYSADLVDWKKLVQQRKEPTQDICIAICGKYTRLEDSYASIVEALNHCSAHFKTRISLKWIETSKEEDIDSVLNDVDAVIIPGGFGKRGIEGKIAVARFCRMHKIPLLGICLGLQVMVVEYARNVCGLDDANSTEFNETKHPVVDILPEQLSVKNKGGTMRLGAYETELVVGSQMATSIYRSDKASERHRHRFEVNPEFHRAFEGKDLVFSGTSQNGRLVEFIELKGHPYYVGTQGHPELKSSLLRPAPLFCGLIKATLEKKAL